MPRGRPKILARPLPLAQASTRLKLLEKAGLTEDRLAAILAKSVAIVETILEDPEVDPFARIAAAKMLARDIIAIAPLKTSGPSNGPQAPVIINIGDMPPAPSREPKAVGRSSTEPQTRVTIDAEPNPA
jgi:hypothetical protein